MHCFMQRHEVSNELVQRVTDYYAFHWQRINFYVSAQSALEHLPPTLQFDAVESLTKEALSKVPLFAKVEVGFMHALTQKMANVNTAIGEAILVEGGLVDGLYIVLRGHLAIWVNAVLIRTLGAGSCFGEQGMIKKEPSGATVRTITYCELYRLSRQGFEDLQSEFQQTFDGFKQAAKLEEKKHAKMDKRAQQQGKRRPTTKGRRASLQGAACLVADLAVGKRVVRTGSSMRQFRSTAGKGFLERSLDKCPTIHPNSNMRAVWAGALMLSLGYEVLSLPFKIVFVRENLYGLSIVCDCFSDLVIIADVIAKFLLAYHSQGSLVDDRTKIRDRYIALGFYPNVISAFPCTLLQPLQFAGVSVRALQMLRALRLVRIWSWFRSDGVSDQQARAPPVPTVAAATAIASPPRIQDRVSDSDPLPDP